MNFADNGISRGAARNRICYVFVVFYLLVMIPVRQYFAPATTADFNQYFMGGVMARQGLWESIYPVPIPSAAANPGNPGASTIKQAYATQAEKAGVLGDMWRYIQPPPTAVLMIPLSWFSYDYAFVVFRTLLCVCCAIVAIYSSQFLVALRGRATGWEGGLSLVVAASPTTMSAIRSGNVSPIVAACVAISVYELAFRQRPWGAASVVLGAILKYVTALLLPVAVLLRRWKTCWQSVAIAIILMAVTLPVTGLAPYSEYLFKLLPFFDKAEVFEANQALRSVLIRLSENPVQTHTLMMVFQAGRWLSLIALFVLIALAARKDNGPRVAMAASASVLAWFLIFSPLSHGHYFLYLFALWGWVVFETGPSIIGRLASVAIIASMWIPLAGGRWSPLPVLVSCHMLYGALAILSLAAMHLMAQAVRKRSV